MINYYQYWLENYKFMYELWLIPSHRKEIVEKGLYYPSIVRTDNF